MRIAVAHLLLPSLILCFFAVPAVGSAQSLEGLTTPSSPLTISVIPQYPLPYSRASLSFLSSGIDLANAKITVLVDGKNIYQGAVQPLAVTLGRAGSITDVSVTLSSGGRSYSQKISIQPQDVSLVVEPISSVPPLYAGKPSVPLGGNVRVVAIANLRSAGGSATDPSSLAYSWSVDGMRIANSSGIGKGTIIVASPLQYRGREVSLSVMSQDGSLVGGASLLLSAEEPSVSLYENDPLLGVRFERALPSSFSITGSEATLYAAPFSFPTTGGAPLLQWFLNGSVAQTGSSITLRPTGSGQGRASLSLVASSGDFARATAELSLSFGKAASSNFFGL